MLEQITHVVILLTCFCAFDFLTLGNFVHVVLQHVLKCHPSFSSWSDEEDEREKSRDPEENVEELTEVTKTVVTIFHTKPTRPSHKSGNSFTGNERSPVQKSFPSKNSELQIEQNHGAKVTHSSRYYYEISVSRPTGNAPKFCTKTTSHKSIILY